MFAVGVCDLPETGGSTFVLVAGLFALVAGVIVTRWVRQSAGRMSVVVAPLVLLGGLVLAPQVTDPCATTTTVAPTTTTTLAPALYIVGDTGPAGGTIFYVDVDRAAGSQYFEVACAGWSDGTCGGSDSNDPQYAWGCQGTPISGADGLAIGDGAQNTRDIVAGCTDAGIAAKRADDLVLGDHSDWFLPSNDELNQMYIQQTAIGGFSADYYWSSSEFDGSNAWIQDFNDGNQFYGNKNYAGYVRPVRAF